MRLDDPPGSRGDDRQALSAIAEFNGWLVSGLGWLIGFLGAGAVVLEAQRLDGSSLAMWAFLLFGWAPVILVHELGHAIAALAAGWRIVIFHVAPWALRTEPFALTFAGSLGGPDVAGYVMAHPPSERERTRAREMAFIAGGPIISLLLAVVLVAWALCAWPVDADIALIAMLRTVFDPNYVWVSHSPEVERAIVFGFGLYSLAGFALSAWPVSTPDGPKNDAAMFLAAWRHGLPPAPHAALSQALSLWMMGVPTDAWPHWIHAELKAMRRDDEQAPLIHPLDLLLALESGTPDQVRATLATMRKAYGDWPDVFVVGAYVSACIDDDPTAAATQLAQIPEGAETSWWFTAYLRSLALAAIAAAAGDRAMCDGRLDAVSQAASAQPFRHAFWRELVARVRRRAAPDP